VVDTSGALLPRDAFDEWMKERLSLESLNAGQLHDATAAFERVLACDEEYAPAHTALANAYFLQDEVTRPENTPTRALLEREESRHSPSRREDLIAPRIVQRDQPATIFLTAQNIGRLPRQDEGIARRIGAAQVPTAHVLRHISYFNYLMGL
jgi:hypothetical protein